MSLFDSINSGYEMLKCIEIIVFEAKLVFPVSPDNVVQ